MSFSVACLTSKGQVLEGEVLPSPSLNSKALVNAVGQRIRLTSVRECRRELARVYAEARAGKLDTASATRFAYLLQTLVGMIRDSDLEDRIRAPERGAHEVGAICQSGTRGGAGWPLRRPHRDVLDLQQAT